MRKRVATLEPNDHHTHEMLPHPSAPAPPRSAGRFQYGSGDSPLAGFSIKRGVGQGGFGEIYYAVSDAGKDVALKLIRRNLEVELRGIRQCLNLKHPHLLDLYDIRQDDRGDTWVVMEYVADQSLEDILASQPNGMNPPDALAWIHGIGAGVAYLHDRGIVHRDLKPGNIFCDEGVVKVGDYGLSKFISCSRRSGHTESIGTVHYMAPEVSNGRYGKEIDVYALGVILYELLTGRVPFEGESIGEVLMKHLTARPDVSMLPEPYRGVVARAMEKDPSLRYRSAAEMLSALPAAPSDSLLFQFQNGRAISVADAVAELAVPDAIVLDSEAKSPPARNGQLAGEYGDADPFSGRRHGGPLHETIVAATAVSEEPILRAVRENVRSFRQSLQEAKRQSPAVYVLLVAGVLLAMIYLWPLVVLLSIALGMLYGAYRLVWTLVGGGDWSSRWRHPDAEASTTTAGQAASAPTASTRPAYVPLRRRETPVSAFVLKPACERLTDLLGSLLGSTLVAAAMCVVMLLIEEFRADTASFPKPERLAWLLLVSVIGAWAVLIPSKFWEGARGDPIVRRFILMVIGMGVGAVAFGLSEWLMTSLPPAVGYPMPLGYKLPPSFYAQDGRPLLSAHVACFGTVFLLIRWWLQANPLRRARLSLGKLMATVVVAGVASWAWQFPQPWLPMVAATISVSVQLSSPWLPPGKRLRWGNGKD